MLHNIFYHSLSHLAFTHHNTCMHMSQHYLIGSYYTHAIVSKSMYYVYDTLQTREALKQKENTHGLGLGHGVKRAGRRSQAAVAL